MQEITEFVNVLPTTSLRTALAVVRRQTVAKKDIALAVANLTLYGAGIAFPADGSPQPFGAAPIAEGDCEAALVALLPAEDGTVAYGKIGDGKLLELFKTLLPLLLKILI